MRGGDWIDRGAERMTCQLLALCIDANDPLRLARFWSGVLGWETAGDSRDGVALVPTDDTGFRIRFLPAQEEEPGHAACSANREKRLCVFAVA